MNPSPPFTVGQLAELLRAELRGDGSVLVRGPAGLADAGPDEISFLANPRYAGQLATTRAAAVVIGPDVKFERRDVAALVHPDPNRAFTLVVQAYAQPEPLPPPGVHPLAQVDPSVRLGPDVAIGPGCVVEAGAVLGARAVLRALVFVGRGAEVGADSYLHPGCVVGHGVRVGERCLLHPGVVLGADGFGFEPGKEFARKGWSKVPQCGTVVLEDDVEIGANSTVDRARFGATRICAGAKLDNLVHVGHNVVVGPRSLLVAQVGIAGSSRLGPGVILAGQAGVSGHVQIAAGVRVGGQSGVHADLEQPGDYFGTPARPLRESMREQGAGRRLDRLKQQLKELEARLAQLEAREGEVP